MIQAHPHAIVLASLLGLAVLAAPGDAPAAACTDKATDLIAGQTLNVGNVNVCNDAATLTVTYETTFPWCLVETNLQVATGLSGIPRNRQGHPTPDRFEDGDRHDCEGEASFEIPLADLGAGVAPRDSVVIAAHAVVDDGTRQEGAWGAGTRFVARGPWATYFTYTLKEPVPCGGEDSRCVFVTSQAYTGNLVGEANTRLGATFTFAQGLAAGDALCQALADADGSLAAPGTYKAWLSSRTVSAADRFTPAAVPYRRVDGTQIARNWSALTSGTLDAPINRTERGEPIPSASEAWTNTRANGLLQDDRENFTCADWINNTTGFGRFGLTAATDAQWTEVSSIWPFQVCGGDRLRLYCFQQ